MGLDIELAGTSTQLGLSTLHNRIDMSGIRQRRLREVW